MAKIIPAKKRILKRTNGEEYEGISQTPERIEFSSTDGKDCDGIRALLDKVAGKTPESQVVDHINEFETFAKSYIGKTGIEPDELEPEWYMRNVLNHIRMLKNYIKDGDLFGALRSALLMEVEREKFNLANDEQDLVSGINSKNAHKNRESAFRKDNFQRWLKENKEKVEACENIKDVMGIEEVEWTIGEKVIVRTVRKWFNEIYPKHFKAGRPKKK